MDKGDQSAQLSSGEDYPEKMFANTFSDSEEEVEDEEDCTIDNIPIKSNDESKSEADDLKKSDETKHLPPMQNNVEADSAAEKQDVPRMKASTSPLGNQEMSRGDSTNYRKFSDGSTKTRKTESVKQMYKDNLKHGWELYEDDLWCMPLAYNKSCQSTPLKKGQSKNGPKNKLRRMMNKSSKKGGYRLVYISPMTMIARMAKQNGYDLATFMETSEFIGGPPLQLPCMQCYEQFGGKYGGGGGMDSWLDGMGQEGTSSNGKCSRCGGQVQTIASFGKTIRQMRDKIENKGLIPHDVYPDGNCLFAAIVDQLRVQGDFSFTSHTLRQSAVNYLKENPTADDGTPLEMFLTNGETWSMYLTRMSEDGEWGDHMILRALANVINKTIVIYGGTSGQNETILSPTSLEERDMAETEDKNSFDERTIYLGHVSESHYISLRPKCWRQELRNGLKQRMKSAKPSVKGEIWGTCPVNQLNVILRQAYRMDCIQTFGSDFIDTCFPPVEMSGYKMDMFGSVVCKLVPCKMKSDSLGHDMSIFFPSAKEDDSVNGYFQEPDFNAFCIPSDSNVISNSASAKSVDLIAQNDAKVIGHLKLVPKAPNKWQGQTVVLERNSREITYLKGFELDFGLLDTMTAKGFSRDSPYLFRLAFKCVWPTLANDWLKRNRKSGFPDEYTIQTVVSEGCHVISLTPDSTMADIIDDPIDFVRSVDDHTWCYTFAAAEKEICRFVSDEQRKSFLVFKALVNDTFKDISLPPSVVKSIFFYACENIEKQRWKSKPGECLLILLKKLAEGLQSHHIEHYFIEEKNLLANVTGEIIDECFDRIECARRMPVVTLYFLLDQFNIMSSEVGCFVEEIIETMKMEFKVCSTEHKTSQSLLPVCTELIQNMIYQDDFQFAWLVFQDVVEEENCDLKTEGVNLIRRLLQDVDVGYIWCFALYIDIKQNTNLTSTVCNGYSSCDHITELLGPECIAELPNTSVPECFSIRNGDLIFIEKVSSILSETISLKLYIKCMKFYLKKYSELAGDSLIISKSSSSMSTTLQLQDNYVSLFNLCHRNGIPEEFLELMPIYTKIVEKLRTQACVRNLVNMWKILGESKKAEDVRQKMGVSSGGTAFQSLFSSILNEYELD